VEVTQASQTSKKSEKYKKKATRAAAKAALVGGSVEETVEKLSAAVDSQLDAGRDSSHTELESNSTGGGDGGGNVEGAPGEEQLAGEARREAIRKKDWISFSVEEETSMLLAEVFRPTRLVGLIYSRVGFLAYILLFLTCFVWLPVLPFFVVMSWFLPGRLIKVHRFETIQLVEEEDGENDERCDDNNLKDLVHKKSSYAVVKYTIRDQFGNHINSNFSIMGWLLNYYFSNNKNILQDKLLNVSMELLTQTLMPRCYTIDADDHIVLKKLQYNAGGNQTVPVSRHSVKELKFIHSDTSTLAYFLYLHHKEERRGILASFPLARTQ
jgi:hypothetical protein